MARMHFFSVTIKYAPTLNHGISHLVKVTISRYTSSVSLTNTGWEKLYEKGKIFVVSRTGVELENLISARIASLAAKDVCSLLISKTSTMRGRFVLSRVFSQVDVCLMAARISSTNILRHLEPSNTIVPDIGGHLRCYNAPGLTQQEGVFGLSSR